MLITNVNKSVVRQKYIDHLFVTQLGSNMKSRLSSLYIDLTAISDDWDDTNTYLIKDVDSGVLVEQHSNNVCVTLGTTVKQWGPTVLIKFNIWINRHE